MAVVHPAIPWYGGCMLWQWSIQPYHTDLLPCHAAILPCHAAILGAQSLLELETGLGRPPPSNIRSARSPCDPPPPPPARPPHRHRRSAHSPATDLHGHGRMSAGRIDSPCRPRGAGQVAYAHAVKAPGAIRRSRHQRACPRSIREERAVARGGMMSALLSKQGPGGAMRVLADSGRDAPPSLGPARAGRARQWLSGTARK
jgi:hypothetical protein